MPLGFAALAASGPGRPERIEAERARFESERQALLTREEGVLEELRRLDLALLEARAKRERLVRRTEELAAAITVHERRMAEVSVRREERLRYLAFRLREQYKDGAETALRRLARPGSADARRAGARTAAYLSDRDARYVALFRLETDRIEAERATLVAQRAEQAARRAEADLSERSIDTTRAAPARLLDRLRDDRETREIAIAELERAARELAERVASIESERPSATLDVRKFRGLLEWPAAGRVGSAFGDRIHPRFRTTVPHPGLDIEAPSGEAIRSVFDGRVVFASWMRGYGLTAIVDHGGGVLSVYAHAAVLSVEPGETVAAGDPLGRIGDTGAVDGPVLYFEIRDAGRPVDPVDWLRRR